MTRLLFFALLSLLVPTTLAATGTGKVPPPITLPDRPAAPAKPSATGEPSRGQLLYENHCQDCHRSTLHVREQRRAATRTALRGWVAHWAQETRLDWSGADIDDVTDYLNRRYYRLPPDRKP
jgi:mono/diheme cytochrome c family protein